MVSNTFSSLGGTVLRVGHRIMGTCQSAFQENTGFTKKYQKEIHCNCVFTGYMHQVFSLKKIVLGIGRVGREKKIKNKCTDFIWNHPMKYLISTVTKGKVDKWLNT